MIIGAWKALLWLRRFRRFLLGSKRMDNEENDGDADARIGDVEGRPRMRQRHVEIEEEKINHVPVEETIGQIPEDAGQ